MATVFSALHHQKFQPLSISTSVLLWSFGTVGGMKFPLPIIIESKKNGCNNILEKNMEKHNVAANTSWLHFSFAVTYISRILRLHLRQMTTYWKYIVS